ncbi:hypothetical protein DH2020_017851 [Rehmannia glutinosa]|uniref:Uncharacterized protein n=1 Tax=Rehmannia glutinosa TaxID=99300 RepID=A0ABR0WKP9_REHGL
MHSVPSNDLLLNKRPHVSSFYGGSSSHRLKHLQKSDRRGFVSRTIGSIQMEVFFPCNTSHYPDISSSGGSSTDPHNLIQNNSKDLSMTDLKTCLTELLSIEDTGISTSGFILSPGKNDTVNAVRENECKDLEKSTSSGYSASKKCFSKCATFPPLREPKSSVAVFMGEKEKHEKDITAEGSTKHSSQCYSRSISLPPEKEMQEAWWYVFCVSGALLFVLGSGLPAEAELVPLKGFLVPLKLVSALKGSREKQGTPPKKLSVTWAPDVYDPIPTSVSHVPSNKNQRYYGKKSRKYKQKGGSKSSRGSRGKDTKQGRKSGGSNKLKPFHEENGVGLVDPHVGTVDYNVGTPDPFCGSSFLKESVTKLHFPVAEAT